MILVIVFLTVLLLAWGLMLLAPSLGLLAYPGEHRRHQEPTPMVGGLAMCIGISLGIVFVGEPYLGLLPCMFLLSITGAIDDRFKLASWLRLIIQGAAAYLMIELTGAKLSSLGSLVSEEELQLQFWALPLTIFAVIGVINALNMSDGLDGLAASLVLMVMIVMLISSPEMKMLTLIIISSVLAFLIWNLRIFRDRAKIFMGDAGSTLLGFLVAYVLIKSTQHPIQSFSPVTALWIVALPLMDAVAVLLIRPLRGQSPFSADRIHYHHLLQAQGFNVNATLLTVLVFQSAFVLIGWSLYKAGIAERYQLVGFLFVFAVYFIYLLRFTKTNNSKFELP